MIPVKIPREEKTQLVQEVEEYMEEQLGAPFGNLASEGLLNHVLSLVTPYIYNQAIQDAKTVTSEEWTRLDEALSVLERPIQRRR